MSIYKLPLSISVPSAEQYPSNLDANEINKRRDSANIVEGFKLKEVKNQKFIGFAEINIDADRIWNLFESLSGSLIGEKAYGIIGFKDEKPKLSRFTDKQRIIDIFKKYKFELANEGYIHFGIAYYDDFMLNEVYIASFKYFKIWTSDNKKLIEALSEFNLKEYENLNFIDEFPVITEALSPEKIEGVHHYSEVLSDIENQFDNL